MLAQQNIETLNEAAPKTIVASCPHCFNTIAERVPAARRELRGRSTTPSCWPGWSSRARSPRPSAGRGEADLPRPVFPGPAQQGLHPAAGDPGSRPGRAGRGDAPVQEPRVLLRRGRRADVDGRTDRQADQHRADRGGPRAEPGHHLHRLPLLPGHARRRRRRQEEPPAKPPTPSKSSTSPRCSPAS